MIGFIENAGRKNGLLPQLERSLRRTVRGNRNPQSFLPDTLSSYESAIIEFFDIFEITTPTKGLGESKTFKRSQQV